MRSGAASSDSPAERYLRAWHDRHPDASRVFAGANDSAGRSSYHRLASLASGSTSILDIGCGSGILLSLVRDMAPGARLSGIDLSESELRVAAARLPAAHFCVARAQALPLGTSSVDVVVSHMALMLMDHPDDVLRESRRVLRAGGRFSAVTNRPLAANPVAKAVLAALRPAWERSRASRRPPRLGDARTFDDDALASLVGAQFNQVTLEQFDVVRYVARDELWPLLIDSIYGVDAIDEADARAILDDLPLPDPVPWTVPMVQVQGRAP